MRSIFEYQSINQSIFIVKTLLTECSGVTNIEKTQHRKNVTNIEYENESNYENYEKAGIEVKLCYGAV